MLKLICISCFILCSTVNAGSIFYMNLNYPETTINSDGSSSTTFQNGDGTYTTLGSNGSSSTTFPGPR